MKVGKRLQPGRYGGEIKEMCCGYYMARSTVRVPPEYKSHHVGWICMKCGAIKLDQDKFDEIKDLFD